MSPRETEDYHAYLLRLWREERSLPWRAELVSPLNGEKRHFATQEMLLQFLCELTSEDKEDKEDKDEEAEA
jgi:hypothetical protein